MPLPGDGYIPRHALLVEVCWSTSAGRPGRLGLLRPEQRAQDVLHDAAVPEVLGLARRVDPHDGLELLAVSANCDLARRVTRIHCLDAGDVEHLVPGQQQTCRALARLELQWQDAHADQVGPVD